MISGSGANFDGCRLRSYHFVESRQIYEPSYYDFLPFPRMEKSKKLSLPKTTKPMIKDLIRIGSQFIGYREYASKTEEKLAEANNRADALIQKLEQSEAARQKAELVASEAKAEADEAKAKVASVEELQKRLEDAESALKSIKLPKLLVKRGSSSV
ncbi:hypothetical protein QYE76_030592 [Lolium multiflorum]|uniref:Uncharacterized protein n=1 Tax=Lolium multiflorum TaxID=4521 RepID=A0AAD8VHQ1_LOLMU|nr:hypothetical protein QYE76_030592 [Lolium multiflorum]